MNDNETEIAIISIIKGFDSVHSWLNNYGDWQSLKDVAKNICVPLSEYEHLQKYEMYNEIDVELFKRGWLLAVIDLYIKMKGTEISKERKWFQDPITGKYLNTEEAINKFINDKGKWKLYKEWQRKKMEKITIERNNSAIN